MNEKPATVNIFFFLGGGCVMKCNVNFKFFLVVCTCKWPNIQGQQLQPDRIKYNNRLFWTRTKGDWLFLFFFFLTSTPLSLSFYIIETNNCFPPPPILYEKGYYLLTLNSLNDTLLSQNWDSQIRKAFLLYHGMFKCYI